MPSDLDAPILDIGCGEGTLLRYLAARGYRDLSGFDLSPQNVELCHRAGLAQVRVGDALDLDAYPSDHFGLVFAFDVLEHLPKERAASFVETVRGLVRPGGALVVQTPNLGSVLGLSIRYGDLTHEFGLTERSARSLFLAAGFDDSDVEIGPQWSSISPGQRLREMYLRVLHRLVFASEGKARPRVPTKNLLIRARRPA